MLLPDSRKSGSGSSRGLSIAGALLAAFGAIIPSIAAADVFAFDLPAGLACESFDLRLEGTTNPRRVQREFYDKDGNVVRYLTAGKGAALTFTNLATGATLSLRANAAVERVVLNPDGTQRWVTTGHNVLILFPTDVPAGPSTTLYVGRVVFTVDSSGIFTLESTTGKSMDICAALSG